MKAWNDLSEEERRTERAAMGVMFVISAILITFFSFALSLF